MTECQGVVRTSAVTTDAATTTLDYCVIGIFFQWSHRIMLSPWKSAEELLVFAGERISQTRLLLTRCLLSLAAPQGKGQTGVTVPQSSQIGVSAIKSSPESILRNVLRITERHSKAKHCEIVKLSNNKVIYMCQFLRQSPRPSPGLCPWTLLGDSCSQTTWFIPPDGDGTTSCHAIISVKASEWVGLNVPINIL